MSCSEEETGLGIYRLSLSTQDGVLSVAVVGVTATMTIAIPNAAERFKYHIWLSDSATDPTKTLNLPSSGLVEWEGFTDATGAKVISFTNDNPSSSWYVWMTLQRLNAGPVITVGV